MAGDGDENNDWNDHNWGEEPINPSPKPDTPKDDKPDTPKDDKPDTPEDKPITLVDDINLRLRNIKESLKNQIYYGVRCLISTAEDKEDSSKARRLDEALPSNAWSKSNKHVHDLRIKGYGDLLDKHKKLSDGLTEVDDHIKQLQDEDEDALEDAKFRLGDAHANEVKEVVLKARADAKAEKKAEAQEEAIKTAQKRKACLEERALPYAKKIKSQVSDKENANVQKSDLDASAQEINTQKANAEGKAVLGTNSDKPVNVQQSSNLSQIEQPSNLSQTEQSPTHVKPMSPLDSVLESQACDPMGFDEFDF